MRYERLWPISIPAKLFLAGLYLLPFCGLVWFVAYLGVNVPRIDQWFLLDLFEQVHRGEAGFADFFAQFHEHRMLVPRLIFVGLAFATGWNIYYELGVSLAIAAFTFLLVVQLAKMTTWLATQSIHRATHRDSGDRSRLVFHLANIFSGLLIFSWTQYQNWLWGFQIPWFLINACLLGVVFALAQHQVSLNKRLLVAAALCFVASFSSAHGLFIWIAVLPSLMVASKRKPDTGRAIIVWGGLFVLCLAGYFAGYQPSAGLAEDYTNSPIKFLGFFFVSMSVPLMGQEVDVSTRDVHLLIGIGLLIFLLFCALAFHSFRRRSAVPVSAAAPWISLGCFSIVFALANSYGRSGESVNQALQSRYVTPGLFVCVAIIQLWAMLLQSSNGWIKWKRLGKVFGGAIATVLLLLHAKTYAPAFQNAVYGDQHHAYAQRKEAICIELIHYMSEQGLSECFLRDRQGSKEKVLRLNVIGLRQSPVNIEFVELLQAVEKENGEYRDRVAISVGQSEVEISGRFASVDGQSHLSDRLPEAVLLSAGEPPSFWAVEDGRFAINATGRSRQSARDQGLNWQIRVQSEAFEAVSTNAESLAVYFYYSEEKILAKIYEIPLSEL